MSDIFGLKKRKGDDGDIFGLKKKKKESQAAAEEPTFGGGDPRSARFSFEERADLFDDLLEEDCSVFPLLDAPREVLADVGSFLDAGRLASLGALCSRARLQLEEAFEDSWTVLLMRDYMPRQRAKRYRAYSAAAAAEASRTGAGLVLTAVDINRTEWDGMLLASPSHLRYRFMQSMDSLKVQWGRLAQSWEWFASRAMHRMTYDQLERFVPGFARPQVCVTDDRFDDVAYRASQDRNLRKRQEECDPSAVIASMKRSLGLPDTRLGSGGDAIRTESEVPSTEANDEEGRSPSARGGAEDVLSAMAPTARDQRLFAAAAAAEAERAAPAEVPTQDAIERMSFDEQMRLALRVSQANEQDGDAQVPAEASGAKGNSPRACPVHDPHPAESAAAEKEEEAVLLRLKLPQKPGAAEQEPLEVVLREFTAGETPELPGHLRRSLEQIALRLTRADWLLFYESIAAEAQLRACLAAYWLRVQWLPGAPTGARRLVELEAVLLTLPIFRSGDGDSSAESLLGGGDEGVGAAAGAEHEEHVAKFLEAWEEHEAWVSALEEHMGPLDLEISRERSNNMQQGKAHTPYAADVLRLAFRNFAICEGRLFFALATAVYGIIARLCDGSASRGSVQLLHSLHSLARAYCVQDDSLAAQRSTLTEYRYYLLEPLRRALKRFLPDGFVDHGEDLVDDCG